MASILPEPILEKEHPTPVYGCVRTLNKKWESTRIWKSTGNMSENQQASSVISDFQNLRTVADNYKQFW